MQISRNAVVHEYRKTRLRRAASLTLRRSFANARVAIIIISPPRSENSGNVRRRSPLRSLPEVMPMNRRVGLSAMFPRLPPIPSMRRDILVIHGTCTLTHSRCSSQIARNASRRPENRSYRRTKRNTYVISRGYAVTIAITSLLDITGNFRSDTPTALDRIRDKSRPVRRATTDVPESASQRHLARKKFGEPTW